MKSLFFLAVLISLALSTFSCKSKKETSSSTTTNSAPTSPLTSPDSDMAIETKTNEPITPNCRLVVSFISKGAGTDSEKRTAFLEYVVGNSKKPAYEEQHWGREGETDYCFQLKELDPKKEQSTFIEGLKKIAAGSDMMIITENALPHKGR